MLRCGGVHALVWLTLRQGGGYVDDVIPFHAPGSRGSRSSACAPDGCSRPEASLPRAAWRANRVGFPRSRWTAMALSLTAALGTVPASLQSARAEARPLDLATAGPAPSTTAVAVRVSDALGGFQPAAGPAPSDFVLPVLDGPPMALRSARGKVVLVHLFATWCEPCREELPALSHLAVRHADSVSVLAIDVGEVDARVRRFFETLPVHFPVLLDRDRAVVRAWGVSALPTTIVLDGNLHLRYRAVGDVAWDSPEVDRLIAGLAGEPQPAPSPQDPSASPGPASAVPHAAIAVTGEPPR